MKWIVFSVFTLLFWIGLYLYNHLGVSLPVTIEVYQAPSQLLVYRPHLGAYHKIGTVIESVEKEMQDRELICPNTFGQYLDDPKSSQEDRLNSLGGCIFEGAFDGITLALKDSELKTTILPARKTIKAEFKGSPAIGPLKVYPRIEAYIHEARIIRDGPMLEIYRVNGTDVTTTYLQPVK